MMEWQDIATAPMDGTPLLVFVPTDSGGFQAVAQYQFIEFTEERWEGWVEIYDGVHVGSPTHWQSLPEPPKATP